jgi:hypothetical protein
MPLEHRLNVSITVDTEHSIGGAFSDLTLKPVRNDKRIYGRLSGKEYGIPLIMNIADSYSIPLTFFVEVLNRHYFGDRESRDVCQYIIDRKHHVQLHVHPNFINFSIPSSGRQPLLSDFMHRYSFQCQEAIIQEGKECLNRFGVGNVTAFRSGCFASNEDTLLALKNLGFKIDSSYVQAYLGNTCLMRDRNLNDATDLCGILEVPITCFIERTGLRPQRYMLLDINAVGFGELRYALNWAYLHGTQCLNIILHSFSFIKPYDVQYKKVRPRIYVIRRFQRLCRYLSENRHKYNTIDITSILSQRATLTQASPVNRFPTMPAYLTIMKALEQVRDFLT